MLIVIDKSQAKNKGTFFYDSSEKQFLSQFNNGSSQRRVYKDTVFLVLTRMKYGFRLVASTYGYLLQQSQVNPYSHNQHQPDSVDKSTVLDGELGG